MTEPLAPWFFRQRFALFGLVYGLSFFGGYIIAGLLGISPDPAFAWPGHAHAAGLAALSCLAAGYALRVWASSFIAASIVWTQDVQLGELSVGGPYRFTRNPLYLGNFLQALGIGSIGPWPVTVLLAVLMLAYCLVLISVEEPYLAQKNGALYAEYRAKVARFFPVPGKVAPYSGRRGSWRDGLRSEAVTGVVTLLVAAYVTRQTIAGH